MHGTFGAAGCEAPRTARDTPRSRGSRRSHPGVVDDRCHPPAARHHHDPPPRNTASSIECVTSTGCGLGAATVRAARPAVLALERVERGERLVHEQQVRVERNRPREPRRWRMPGEFAGERVRELREPTRSSASNTRDRRSARPTREPADQAGVCLNRLPRQQPEVLGMSAVSPGATTGVGTTPPSPTARAVARAAGRPRAAASSTCRNRRADDRDRLAFPMSSSR